MKIREGSQIFQKGNLYYLACFDTKEEVTLIGYNVMEDKVTDLVRVDYKTLNSEFKHMVFEEEPINSSLYRVNSVLGKALEYFNNLLQTSIDTEYDFKFKDFSFKLEKENLISDFTRESFFSPYNKRKPLVVSERLVFEARKLYFNILYLSKEGTIHCIIFDNNIKGKGKRFEFNKYGVLEDITLLDEELLTLVLEDVFNSPFITKKTYCLASKPEIKNLKNSFN